MRLITNPLGLLLASILLVGPAYPHGGQYRGPRDIVPPGGGNSPTGPSTPTTPSTPSTPTTPTGPVTPPPPPTAPNNGPVTAPGLAGPTSTYGSLPPAFDCWNFWWEFNKDRFLNLKRRISSIEPTTNSDEFFLGIVQKKTDDRILVSREKVKNRIYPTILAVLDDRDWRMVDEVSSALVALAKLGVNPEESCEAIKEFLKEKNGEVRETAALSLGILAAEEGVEPLLDILLDTPRGRQLTSRPEVDLRTRAFAAFGLGLAGHRLKDAEVRARITAALLGVLEKDRSSTRDLMVACVTALGLVKHEDNEVVRLPLLELLGNTRRKNIDVTRAHIPTALVRMGCAECIPTFLEMLGRKKENRFVRQSLVLATGQAAEAQLEFDREKATQVLIDLHAHSRKMEERNFCGIALGQLGMESGVNYLIKQLATGKQIFRPWTALGLGVYCHLNRDAMPEVMEVLTVALRREKDPSKKGAYAIALGLARHQPAASILLEEFESSKIEDTRGYMAVGLGLMKAPVEDRIRPELKKSVRKPTQLQQIAIGLGLMGSSGVVEELVELIQKANTTSVLASISQALGFIGDINSVEPLCKIVKDRDVTGEGRAFAIVALGLIGENEELPWNSKIAENINYHAAVSTLTGGALGILDIL